MKNENPTPPRFFSVGPEGAQACYEIRSVGRHFMAIEVDGTDGERCEIGPAIVGGSWPALRADLVAIGAPTV